MGILNFLIENWSSALVVVVLIALFVYLYIRGEKKVIYKILLFLITEAEKTYGSGTGELKLASVITKLYDKLPTIIKIVITGAQLIKWVEEALLLAKQTWAENAAIESYVKSNIKISDANKE